MIAVTDHHDVVMAEYVIGAAAEHDDFLVFAGVEITCRDGVQVIALFEPTTAATDWLRLLHNLPEVVPTGPAEGRVQNLTECGLTVAELFEKVASDGALSPITLLLPHFGPESGHKSLNVPGQAARAKDLPHDAVYVECHFSALDEPTLDKIRGKISDWGERRRAIVATGDNKRSDFARLGVHECWIKLGEDTLEALRQAFLADGTRIAYARPPHPSEHIVAVQVFSSLMGPEPVRLVFNDGFNALIGGRGSGKSAILEYLRFGLCRTDEDLEQDEQRQRTRRQRAAELISETLGDDGYVAVTLERNGARETWTRTGAAPERVAVSAPGVEETLTVTEAQRRFPARAFAQKELSTTMLNRELAVENITGIASAEAIEDRRRVDQSSEDARREITRTVIEAAAYWQAKLNLDQANHAVADIQRRQEALSAQLESGGVQADDVKIIAEAQAFVRAEKFLDEVDGRVEADKKALQTAREAVLRMSLDRAPDVTRFPEIAPVLYAIDTAGLAAREYIDAAIAALDQLAGQSGGARERFEASRVVFAEQYRAASERQAQHGAIIAESGRLADRMKDALAAQSNASQAEIERRSAPDALQAARATLADLVSQRRQIMKNSADKIAEKSAGALLARLERDRAPSEAIQALRALFDGSRFRETEAHCEERVKALFADEPSAWDDFCGELLDIYRDKLLAGGPTEPSAEAGERLRKALVGVGGTMTHQQLAKAYTNLSDQTLGSLLAAGPRDGIALTYISDGQRIPFQQASPGQQASALLRLLLRQSAGTLIVDQPEDDLDNRVLMQIVAEVGASRSHRQLIFATHNPNLVVNGDADKVVVMRATVPEDRAGEGAARVTVEVDGAIETPEVREAITAIMEGGLEAFDTRARRYGVERA